MIRRWAGTDARLMGGFGKCHGECGGGAGLLLAACKRPDSQGHPPLEMVHPIRAPELPPTQSGLRARKQ